MAAPPVEPILLSPGAKRIVALADPLRSPKAETSSPVACAKRNDYAELQAVPRRLYVVEKPLFRELERGEKRPAMSGAVTPRSRAQTPKTPKAPRSPLGTPPKYSSAPSPGAPSKRPRPRRCRTAPPLV